jgi:hypothetical protein
MSKRKVRRDKTLDKRSDQLGGTKSPKSPAGKKKSSKKRRSTVDEEE